MDKLKKTGRVNEEGYVNVADQLGLSGERGTRPSLYCPFSAISFLFMKYANSTFIDSSTYYQPWDYRGSYYYGQRGYR